MPKRKKIHVVKNSERGGWDIKNEHASRASSNHDTKQEAVERAREIAKNQEPSQVIIHKENGRIQTEHTYGKDPYPPKG